MHSIIQRLSISIILIFSFVLVKSQTIADLKKINKTPNSALEDQKELDSLQAILTDQFLKKANNPKDNTNKLIQGFFGDYSLNARDTAQYNYPKKLEKSNLSISVTGFDYSWSLLPKYGDTVSLEGDNDREIDAIVSIPVYESYRRGYSIHSISFLCKLKEVINWIEKRDNNLPIENLPSYKRTISLEAKLIDFDK